MSEAHRLIVGARGWNHDGWNGTFYPEDLPQDWRLSYYANEFTGVLVPEPVWRAADPSIIGGWLGDVADGFLFYLEQHDPRASSQISFSHRKLFGSHWGGIPVSSKAVWSGEEEWNLRRLRERFNALRKHPRGVTTPGFFISGNPPEIDHMREARLLADML